MNDIVSEFINQHIMVSRKYAYDKNLYKQLLQIHENTGFTYKPKTQDEFHDIIYAL